MMKLDAGKSISFTGLNSVAEFPDEPYLTKNWDDGTI